MDPGVCQHPLAWPGVGVGLGVGLGGQEGRLASWYTFEGHIAFLDHQLRLR